MQMLRDEGQDTMEAAIGCENTARIACGGDVSHAKPERARHAASIAEPALEMVLVEGTHRSDS